MINFRGEKVLVTGGAGFIGSHISEFLANEGAHVVVLDNLSTGNIENLKHILPSIEFMKGDVRSFEDCAKATSNVDVVFHTAAFVSVPESIKYPDLCYDINIEGTRNILESCIQNMVKGFVFSSSAAVYGNRNDVCYETDATNPQSPYATSKLEGEKLSKLYSLKNKLNSVCLRYFNVYGDRQSPESEYAAVVPKFTKLIQQKKPLSIFGTGKQTRDFIHVAEVVKANILLGNQDDMKGEIFNVATGISINILDLVDRIKKQLKSEPSRIDFMPARDGDILNSRANCNKYTELASSIKDFPLESNKNLHKELSV